MSLSVPRPAGRAAPAPSPNLEYHRNRAKALLKSLKSGSDPARLRFEALQIPVATAKLADAQFVVAREQGFASWARLKTSIERLNPQILRPYVRDVDWYRDRAEGLRRSYAGGMGNANAVIRQFHPRFQGMSVTDFATAEFELEDALLVTARQHGFSDWAEFVEYLESLKAGQEREPFLLAFEAIKTGNIQALRELLQEEPALAMARGSNGNSLLNLAVCFPNQEMSELLLGAGAPVNLGNNYGWTPLHQAAIGKSWPLVQKLLEAGGDLTLSARGEGGTPLVQALFWGHDAIADALAEKIVSPRNLRVAGGLGRIDLLEACFTPDGSLTKEAGESQEFYRPHGEFPEWKPSGSPQEILDEAFTYACRNGRADVLEFLLQRGANIGGDPYRGTGLIWAAWGDRRETVRWLVQHGADINQQATFGGRSHGVGVTVLHLATQDGNLDKVRFLVELGADPDIPDHLFNATTTDWAEFFGHSEIAAYLLALPNVGILNLASRGLTERIAALLDQQPNLVNGSEREKRIFPIHRSVENGFVETSRLLLEKGAHSNRVDFNGKTALDIAEVKKDEELIGLLESFGAQKQIGG